jgi:hypothetical protein
VLKKGDFLPINLYKIEMLADKEQEECVGGGEKKAGHEEVIILPDKD